MTSPLTGGGRGNDDGLFGPLPKFPPALPDDELRLLAGLPDWDTVREIEPDETAAARRLEKRGLIKINREKNDPVAIRPTLYAGRLPPLRTSHSRPSKEESTTNEN